MDTPEPQTFREFWPRYLAEHAHPACRKLHFAGTTLALLALFLGFVASPWWFAGAPLLGYGLAWVGHFVFERNRPATFRHPWWSLRGDFELYARTWARLISPPKQTR